jgi:hypothetical protein
LICSSLKALPKNVSACLETVALLNPHPLFKTLKAQALSIKK